MIPTKPICDIESLFHEADGSKLGPMLKGVVLDETRKPDGVTVPPPCEAVIFSGRYQYHPTIPFNRLEEFPKDDMKLGVELESVAKNRQELFNIRKFQSNCIYLQRDGSLPEETGYEITTIPLPALWATRPEFWKTLLKDYRERSELTNTACGLHVHVDKKFFGATPTLAAERVAYSCYLYGHIIPEEHPTLLRSIFGRDTNGYCKKYANKHLSTFRTIGLESLSTLAFRRRSPDDFTAEGGHHTEISVTGKTVEFRRGQGTFDPAAIARIVQFIHSVALFSKFITGPKQVTMDRYTAFVQKHLSSHKELNETLLKGISS